VSTVPEPFWGWPEWKHLGFATWVSLIGTLWFVVVYGGCDAITAHRLSRIRIHLDSELNIPFIPETVLIYMSIYVLFFVAPFILRQRREFLTLAIALDVIILVGGIGFLLIPAQLGFASPTDLGAFPGLFHFADRLNLTYNLVPSLHVALSVACIATYAQRTGIVGKVLLWIWGVSISVSTLFTHQHHLLDVVAGWTLALVVFRVLRERTEETKRVGSRAVFAS
jgi:membrane-associated phospholipid phosphatase